MKIKNNFLIDLLFLIFLCINISALPQQSPLKQKLLEMFPTWTWLHNLLGTKEKKFTYAVRKGQTTWKPLSLYTFFQRKEDDNKSIVNPIKSAKKFKDAFTDKAQNNEIIKKHFAKYPKFNQFLFGASSSSYQYEGGLDENNANALFYIQQDLEPAEVAINFWHTYKEDIKQMKEELGINAFRLSIAWERIQPDNQTLNKDLSGPLGTYIDIIKTLKNYGIEPIVVLNHYTVPQWFLDKDGFEKIENINDFVVFAKTMYEALHEHVTYWSTFNAIEGYAFKGYWTHDGPPNKHNMALAQTVMAHMLQAHVQTYQAIKGKDGLYQQYKQKNQNIPEPCIGIQKNIVLLDRDERSTICVQTLTGPACAIGTYVQNRGFFNFFTKGEFKVSIPGWFNSMYKNEIAPHSIDWIGLNTYGNMWMRGLNRPPEDRIDFKTENQNYRDYPEGMYRAVKIIYDELAKPLNIPIIITENGIATTNDTLGNEKRTRFIRRTLYTIRKLIQEDYPIIGYTPWASHDNYEWPTKHTPPEEKDQPDPYNRPYGFFHVNFDKNSSDYLKRTLKEGAEYYRDFIKRYFDPNI